MVEKLNGIFAFAVWDNKERRLFMARDRMGVKPLFYTLQDGAMIFASEIKTLLAHPCIDPVLHADGIAEIMLIDVYKRQLFTCDTLSDLKQKITEMDE